MPGIRPAKITDFEDVFVNLPESFRSLNFLIIFHMVSLENFQWKLLLARQHHLLLKSIYCFLFLH